MEYVITYRTPGEADEATRNSADELPTTGDLDDAIENCKSLGLEADLRDEAGFRRGWVHCDGDYRLV